MWFVSYKITYSIYPKMLNNLILTGIIFSEICQIANFAKFSARKQVF